MSQDYLGYLGDVDKALEDFYVEAIREATKQTDVPEDKIREWFEKILITSSGTRSTVNREHSTTGEIPRKNVQ